MLKRTVCGILWCVLPVMLAAQSGQFLQAPQYAAGINPQAVVVGDFNNDGNLDLAVANSTGNTVSILLGKGDGTFLPKVNYVTGTTPLGIATGDFNGDGNLDLAITNSVSDTVSVLLGNGDGSFQAKVDYNVGHKPVGVAIADFNGDHHPDIVVTNAQDGNVGVLLNKGTGTFAAQVTYNTGFNPTYVATGDFNNDGFIDLAVANANNNNIVSVLLGNGNGTFQNQFQNATGNTPTAVAVGDFNGDGKLDMAVVDQFGNTVSVLLGNGKGGFSTHVDYPTSAFPNAVTVADFNGDGHPDIAVSAGNGNTITVLFGNGDGTFQPEVNFGTGDIPYSVVQGDFNKDGKIDLAVANSGGGSVSVVINNGDGTFQARADYPAGPNPNAVATADFNGDGFLDLAVANSNCPNFPTCGAGTISIIFGNGNGSFQSPVEYSTGTDTDPYELSIGDFNGDGNPDIAVANYATGTVGVFLGAANGTFTGHQDYPVGSEPASVANGDFNGDGFPDLVVANFHSNTISVLLNNGKSGSGTFKSAVTYNVGHGPISVAVADFNGDGKLDLVVVNETDNNASILLGNGDGTFQAQQTYPTGVGGNPLSVVVGDFNGDGNLDLAVADFQTQQVSVLLGNGDGTFQSVKAYSTGANPSSIVIADFNGDGKADLALTSTPLGSAPGNLVSLLLGNGDGTFGPPSLFGTGSQAYSAAVGDFNQDGAADLAVANGISSTVSLLLNIQGTAINLTTSGSPSGYSQPVTFTASVAASVSNGAAPTGSVTFSSTSNNVITTLGSGTLVNGKAAVSSSTLPTGTDTISAAYSGDANYQAHTVTITQTVTKAASSTVVTSSINPADPNQQVTFTATVSSNLTGQPTGTVTFKDGSTQIGSGPVSTSTGKATYSTSTLALGTHTITAVYSGDSNFNTSTSPVLNQLVGQSNTSTALTSSANPSTPSQSVTFTAAVTSPNGTPTGTVQFLDGTTLLGSSTLNGSAVTTFTVATLATGTHSITAVYGGDSNSDPSTSSALSQVVQKANSSTALTAPAAANLNQSVTFNATVTAATSGIPTGSVNFMLGATQLGSTTVNASGVATFSTSTLAAGSHTITAAYSGDGNFNLSTSPAVTVVVTAPGFSLAASNLTPGTVSPGASATSTVTITTVGGLSASGVTLACSVTPVVSPAATCSLGSVSTSGTATLTFAATGPQASLALPGDHGRFGYLAFGLMIPAMLLGGASLSKPNRRKFINFCLLFIALTGTLAHVACGGSPQSNNNNTNTGNSGTPRGIYTVVVTGTATGVQNAAPVTLAPVTVN